MREKIDCIFIPTSFRAGATNILLPCSYVSKTIWLRSINQYDCDIYDYAIRYEGDDRAMKASMNVSITFRWSYLDKLSFSLNWHKRSAHLCNFESQLTLPRKSYGFLTFLVLWLLLLTLLSTDISVYMRTLIYKLMCGCSYRARLTFSPNRKNAAIVAVVNVAVYARKCVMPSAQNFNHSVFPKMFMQL